MSEPPRKLKTLMTVVCFGVGICLTVVLTVLGWHFHITPRTPIGIGAAGFIYGITGSLAGIELRRVIMNELERF